MKHKMTTTTADKANELISAGKITYDSCDRDGAKRRLVLKKLLHDRHVDISPEIYYDEQALSDLLWKAIGG